MFLPVVVFSDGEASFQKCEDQVSFWGLWNLTPGGALKFIINTIFELTSKN